MEGYSIIYYKDKPIIHLDYTDIGSSKEKVLQLLKYVMEEFPKHPPNSLIVLVDFTNIHVDMDVVNAFKEVRIVIAPHKKKVATSNTQGVLKLAYEFVVSLTHNDFIRAFDSELEAKEWLISDSD